MSSFEEAVHEATHISDRDREEADVQPLKVHLDTLFDAARCNHEIGGHDSYLTVRSGSDNIVHDPDDGYIADEVDYRPKLGDSAILPDIFYERSLVSWPDMVENDPDEISEERWAEWRDDIRRHLRHEFISRSAESVSVIYEIEYVEGDL